MKGGTVPPVLLTFFILLWVLLVLSSPGLYYQCFHVLWVFSFLSNTNLLKLTFWGPEPTGDCDAVPQSRYNIPGFHLIFWLALHLQ